MAPSCDQCVAGKQGCYRKTRGPGCFRCYHRKIKCSLVGEKPRRKEKGKNRELVAETEAEEDGGLAGLLSELVEEQRNLVEQVKELKEGMGKWWRESEERELRREARDIQRMLQMEAREVRREEREIAAEKRREEELKRKEEESEESDDTEKEVENAEKGPEGKEANGSDSGGEAEDEVEKVVEEDGEKGTDGEEEVENGGEKEIIEN